MLSEQQIQINRDRFTKLLYSITREGCDIDGLVARLDNIGFFTAPASAKYHCDYDGGLCEHSLNVYDTLEKIVEMTWPSAEIPFDAILPDSRKIVALLCNVDSAYRFERAVYNEKVYSPKGSKSDDLGTFDWKSQLKWKAKESKDTYLFGTHGQNSERMISFFIPLSDEESCAIINHHSIYDNPSLNIFPIYQKYSLAALLHIADLYSTIILEKTY